MNIRWLQCSMLLLATFQISSPMHMARQIGALQEDNQLCPGFSCRCITTTMCCALLYVCCKEHGLYCSERYVVQSYCCTTNGAWPCASKPIINHFDYEKCHHVQYHANLGKQAQLLAANRTGRIDFTSKMQ